MSPSGQGVPSGQSVPVLTPGREVDREAGLPEAGVAVEDDDLSGRQPAGPDPLDLLGFDVGEGDQDGLCSRLAVVGGVGVVEVAEQTFALRLLGVADPLLLLGGHVEVARPGNPSVGKRAGGSGRGG